MFDNKNANTPKPSKTEPTGEQIHTMPMDYYLGEKTVEAARSGKSVQMPSAVGSQPAKAEKAKPETKKKWLTFAIAGALVLVVAASIWLLVKSYEQPAETLTPELSAVEEPVIRPVEVEPAETPEPLESLLPAEPLVEEPSGPTFNPADINRFSLSLLSSLDQDRDGLTDVEEALIGTDPGLIDTDGDTYRDGEELKNFYSPLDAGPMLLADKEFIGKYENTTYGYKLLYPASWLVDAVDAQDPEDVMLTSNQNEFVNILIAQKASAQTLAQWYLEKAPALILSDLKQYQTAQGLSAIESPDAFTVYLSNADTVYIINYNIGLKEEASFPNLFRLVVNTFEFVE